MVKVLVSSCLLGEPVRHHGGDARCDNKILDRWRAEGRLVPMCPETAAGLTVPRLPAEIAGGDGRGVLEKTAIVTDSTGADVTEVFLLGARLTVEAALAHKVGVAILKDGSPSCATSYIHDGTFRHQRGPGLGVTAAMLSKAGVRVFNEHQLEEAAACLSALEAGRDA